MAIYDFFNDQRRVKNSSFSLFIKKRIILILYRKVIVFNFQTCYDYFDFGFVTYPPKKRKKESEKTEKHKK